MLRNGDYLEVEQPRRAANITSPAPQTSTLPPRPTASSGSNSESPLTARPPPLQPPNHSPSSAHAIQSPPKPSGLIAHSEGHLPEAGARRVEQPRMRSSIACARCRRSKVKCINSGVNTPCRACETTGRECTYPPPAVPGGGGLKREGSVSGYAGADAAAFGETPKRHRAKKSTTSIPTATAIKNSPRVETDALDTAILTPKVWAELFEIYQLHFSTDLPFLHAPTFLKPLRQSTLHSSNYGVPAQDSESSTPLPPASPVLLLAFLTLTSRFHPQLVLYHSPPTATRPSQPLVAAEYYFHAAKARAEGMYGENTGVSDLERTQALLMLALHEWGMCRGVRAWLAVGVAIRSAQVLGLQFERELDDMPIATSLAMSAEVEYMGINPHRRSSSFGKGGAFVEQEIRRRTFWSCFAMDRYLSSGKYRPQMLNVSDLQVQLPSSERAFLFGEKVRTLQLGEELNDMTGRVEAQSHRRSSMVLRTDVRDLRHPKNGCNTRDANTFEQCEGREDEENGRWEVGADEGALSRYLKILDLYGRIVKWSCAGGRRYALSTLLKQPASHRSRREQYPPWDERSTFYELHHSLNAFDLSLSRHLTLSSANTSAHVSQRTSTPYALMHMVQLLCRIILHREYVPFIPLRCTRPQGPLDPPLFPADKYTIPIGFWDQSARELFRAARNLIDLARTCHEWGVLVETPIAGFAIYTVAFVGKQLNQILALHYARCTVTDAAQASMLSTSPGWTRTATCASGIHLQTHVLTRRL